MLNITPNIRINGIDYKAKPESSKGGCAGCAFEHDIEQCEQSVQFHSCSAEQIIWVKEENTIPNPIPYAPNPVEDKTANPNVGRKYDSGKPRYSLLPTKALEEVVKVLTFGSQKYEDFNWMKVPNANDRYFSAAQRHMWQWKDGETHDSESKLHHLASSITNLMFILELELREMNNAGKNPSD